MPHATAVGGRGWYKGNIIRLKLGGAAGCCASARLVHALYVKLDWLQDWLEMAVAWYP